MHESTDGWCECRCKEISCLLESLLTDDCSKKLFFSQLKSRDSILTLTGENQVSGAFEQYCMALDNMPCMLLHMLKVCCAISHAAQLFKNFNMLFCSACSHLIVSSISSETKEIAKLMRQDGWRAKAC